MRFLALLVLVVGLLGFTPAQAKAPVAIQPATSNAAPVESDLVSLGAGYFDFTKDTQSHLQSADFRLEYRWGISLLPLISSYFKSWDNYVQFHPFVGAEFNSWGSAYGLGGFAMDAYITRNIIFTWSEGVGFFEPGDMRSLGSFIEFRSQAELGYRFDNDMRVSAQISHISNAGITKRNPGAEIAGLYVHIPTSMFCSSTCTRK